MDEERFAISAEKYLERHQLLAYLEDAVAQLLDHKDENPKVNTNKFFSEYFTSVKEGNHTLFREYSYIAATAHNRACFVRTFWKCFRHIGKKGDLLNIREYHSLVSLLCGDFPVDILHKTATIILLDDAMECLISFSDFLYTFQLQFYYEEFIEKCREIFKSIEQSQNSPRGAVVIPSSNQSSPPLQNGAAGNDGKDNKSKENGVQHADGIDAMQFFRALVPLCASFEKSCPSVDILRDLLWNEERVTFYGFLMTLAKSESLNENIGQLPASRLILDTPDGELTLPPIRPVSAARSRPSSAARPRSANQDGRPTLTSGSRVTKTKKKIFKARTRMESSSSEDDDDDDDDSDTN